MLQLRGLEPAAPSFQVVYHMNQIAINCNTKGSLSIFFLLLRSTIASAVDSFGHIDFLINNGGGQFPQTADKMKLKAWNAVVETNLTGTFLMSREGGERNELMSISTPILLS